MKWPVSKKVEFEIFYEFMNLQSSIKDHPQFVVDINTKEHIKVYSL